MQDYPHYYRVASSAQVEGEVTVTSPGLQTLATAPPAEFGGPGDRWSPETLFTASVADCFILTFRAIARASKYAWSQLECEVEGVLDRVEKTSRFTEFTVHARLFVPEGMDPGRGRRLLEKAEKSCLITNSLTAETKLVCHVAHA
ncbi:MAG: OsmC family protein [Acidobacteriota bacterium]|nr:OsmC family protein [Acidobacteriota bacterium]